MFRTLLDIIFPNICPVCRQTLVEGESTLCLGCLASLPRTDFHLQPENSLRDRIFNRSVPVDKATSLFYYMKGNPYVAIIHETKYHNRPRVGMELARMHARELIPTGFFDGIDLIVPVPLHWFRRFRRGYNQAERIAAAIGSETGITVASTLNAASHTSQTRKDAHARLRNAMGVYSVADSDAVQGNNILLVDDVITTGATMMACLSALKSASPSSRLSVYSLGVTRLA